MADNKDKKILNVPALVPALRFPEFTGEWEKCKLEDITINFNLRNKDRINYPMYSVTNNRGFVPQSEQFEDREMIGEDIKAYKIIHKNDFAYNPARINVGSIAKYNGDNPCMISSLYVCFKACNRVDSDWLMQLLKTPRMNFYYNTNGEGGVRVYLFYPNFSRISTSLPIITEQKKIAKFLSLLDERIATQNKIIEKLETLIKGIVELAFSHAATSNTLGCHIKQISQRNKNGKDLPVLSVSNKYGFVEQSEQFEDRIIASDDTSNYKIVSINDFAFNPARINVGSIARLKDKECGIVSPMYICFRTSKDILPEYLELFFKTVTFSSEVGKRLEGSVRLCLSFESLCEIVIPVISIREQQSLVKMATAFYSKLDVEKGILRSYQSQKQYLLSQMFI